MNDNNTQYFNMLLIGMEYKKSIISKPEYLDWNGRLKKEVILTDLSSAYRQMKDDELIQKLIDFKKQSVELVAKGNYCQFSNIQIERQMLTNAYALNHGASPSSVSQLSILDERILSYYYSALFLYNCYQSYFKHRAKLAPAGLGDWVNLEKYSFALEFSSRNSCLQHFDKRYRSSFVDYFGALNLFKDVLKPDCGYGMHEISLYSVEIFMDHYLGQEVFKALCSNFASLKTNINSMLSNWQFPPYGVALSINYEDDGQRVLPWSGNLTDSQISHLRRKMHDLAGNEPLDICRVILAAYCRFYFNDEPTVKQVSQEFYPFHIDPGFFSREVTSKIKGTKPKTNKTTKKSSIKSYNTGLKIWVDCRNEQMVREAIRCEKCRLFYDTLDLDN